MSKHQETSKRTKTRGKPFFSPVPRAPNAFQFEDYVSPACKPKSFGDLRIPLTPLVTYEYEDGTKDKENASPNQNVDENVLSPHKYSNQRNLPKPQAEKVETLTQKHPPKLVQGQVSKVVAGASDIFEKYQEQQAEIQALQKQILQLKLENEKLKQNRESKPQHNRIQYQTSILKESCAHVPTKGRGQVTFDPSVVILSDESPTKAETVTTPSKLRQERPPTPHPTMSHSAARSPAKPVTLSLPETAQTPKDRLLLRSAITPHMERRVQATETKVKQTPNVRDVMSSLDDVLCTANGIRGRHVAQVSRTTEESNSPGFLSGFIRNTTPDTNDESRASASVNLEQLMGGTGNGASNFASPGISESLNEVLENLAALVKATQEQ